VWPTTQERFWAERITRAERIKRAEHIKEEQDMGNAMLVTGIDFVCAALTLAYVGKLLLQTIAAHESVSMACGVAKISLRGQQIYPRSR
jgi:hypothetical protein